MPIADLRDYLVCQFEAVEGWCWKYVWQPLEFIDQKQRELGATGPVAEVGVYHGRFFLGLAALKKDASSPHVVIDVFDMQEFSMSGSGTKIRVPKSISSAQLPAFESNLRRAGFKEGDVRIIRADSVALSPGEIREMVDGLRKFLFFSVDGCHEFTHTYHDLHLAIELTSSFGIILVDDYLHARWPGVQEAVAKLYFGGAPRFVPLFYIHNKLALCHVNLHQEFFEGLQSFYAKHHASAHVRTVTRFGWPTLTIEPRVGSNVIVGLPESGIMNVNAHSH